MSLIMRLIVGLIVFLHHLKRIKNAGYTPLPPYQSGKIPRVSLASSNPSPHKANTHRIRPQDTGLRASTDSSEKSYEPSCSLSLQLGGRCRLHLMTLATQPCSDRPGHMSGGTYT